MKSIRRNGVLVSGRFFLCVSVCFLSLLTLGFPCESVPQKGSLFMILPLQDVTSYHPGHGAKGTFSVVLVQLSSWENSELLGPIDELPK